MSLLNILSLILFIIFLSSYIFKLMILYKKNKISANLLGKDKKNNKIKVVETTVKISTFILGITWVVEIFAGQHINKNLYTLYGINNNFTSETGNFFSFIGMK